MMQIDLRVLELLSSKLCHDLISPVSAINNGVELIEDIGGDVVGEAMKLIGSSAVQASRRLKLFRVAYGRAGSEENLPVKDVRQIVEQYFMGSKITAQWPDEVQIASFVERRGSLKALINMFVMAEEILAYGGSITLKRLEADDKTGCCLEIVGRSATLAEASQAAMRGEGPVEDLTPRTIQSYITGRFAAHFGFHIETTQVREDCSHLSLSGEVIEYDHHQDE